MYDVTSRKSFEALQTWLSDVKERADKNVVICIAGNKMDLKYDQNVRIEDGESWAEVSFYLHNFNHLQNPSKTPVFLEIGHGEQSFPAIF